MKFGHFTAGGNVTINYTEMPDEQALKSTFKKLADELKVTPEPSSKELVTEGSEVEEAVAEEAPEEFSLAEELATIADMANKTLEMAQMSGSISLGDIEFNDEAEIVIPEGKKLNIHCKRSFIANICQSDPATVKTYYN